MLRNNGKSFIKPQTPGTPSTPALFAALRFARWLGVAPVRVPSGPKPTRLTIHHSWCVRAYGYTLTAVLLVINLAGIVLDLSVSDQEAVRATGGMTSVVWAADLLLVLAVATIGGGRAVARLGGLIDILEKKERIDKELAQWPAKTSTSKLQRYQAYIPSAVVMYICGVSVSDYKLFYDQAARENRNLSLAFMLVPYYVSFLTLVVLQLEFCSLTSALLGSMHTLNCALEHELHALETNQSMMTTTTSPSAVRHLTQLQSSLCGLTRAADGLYRHIVLLLLLTHILHLIVSPYYIITGLSQVGWWTITKLTTQVTWLVGHTLLLVGLIEPCHRSTVEAQKTAALVNRMCQLAATIDRSLNQQLMVYSRTLAAEIVEYQPLGLCTLSRPLMTSIVSGVTTYLMILVQFQKISANIGNGSDTRAP